MRNGYFYDNNLIYFKSILINFFKVIVTSVLLISYYFIYYKQKHNYVHKQPLRKKKGTS